jgi:GPH family glycoside/pentoside/hexuronide:cation symporter
VSITRQKLPAWALFSAMISMAGLPIYMHAPKYYVDTYQISLSALGATLFVVRLIDVVQDPLLGWVAQHYQNRRGLIVSVSGSAMALGMVGLFAVTPSFAPLLWFGLCLIMLFSAFSMASICFYAQGIGKAQTLGPLGHVRLAGWREGGALLGVSLAAVIPLALSGMIEAPFAGLALGFGPLVLLALWFMRDEWHSGMPVPLKPISLLALLRQKTTRRYLILALLNGAPVAVTSTLFLFFVESRLQSQAAAGPLLLLFFLAAALSAPLWARLAGSYGSKLMLQVGMILAILTFGCALLVSAGQVMGFALICLVSGMALGADMTLLPAIFARHLEATWGRDASALGFGLWAFVSKFSLALAAVILLPALDHVGYGAGRDNSAQSLWALSALYTLFPCFLKCAALVLLTVTRIREPNGRL